MMRRLVIILLLMTLLFTSCIEKSQELPATTKEDLSTVTPAPPTPPGNYTDKFGLSSDRTFGFVPVEIDLDLAAEKGLTTSDGLKVNDDYLFVSDTYRRALNIILDSAGVGDFDSQIKSGDIPLVRLDPVNKRSNHGDFTDVDWSCFYLANFCNVERLSMEDIDLILSFKESETDSIPDAILTIVENSYPEVVKVYANSDHSTPIGYDNAGEYTFENRSVVLVVSGSENYAVSSEQKQRWITAMETALTDKLKMPVRIMIKSI